MPVEEGMVKRIDDLIEKGSAVIATYRPSPPRTVGFPTLNSGAFTEWRTQVLSFLANLLGPDHVYTQNFESKVRRRFASNVESGQGILRAVREDIQGGFLTDVKTLLSAQVFTDFLEMTEHLLDQGYKDPAASLCGAVLENGLRRIAANNNVKLKTRENLASLNQKCADAGIYNRLVQKKVQVWIEVRNNADHGGFGEYSEEDVDDMIQGVSQFLGDYLG